MPDQIMKGFHKKSRQERLKAVQSFCALTDQEVAVLSGEIQPDPAAAENFIENVIGYFPIPLGVATYFKVDGKDLMIPMAVEETSIIAAASATAKWVRSTGSIRTYVKGRMIIGQIQIPFVENANGVRAAIRANRNRFIDLANAVVPGLVKRGGGVVDIHSRIVERVDGQGDMVVLHVLCDPCDAMGANLINQVCEVLKPQIEECTGERVGLCILSNLMDSRIAGAEVLIRDVDPKIGYGIVEATDFAKADPYRATTHNKGVLNGIDPILIATGNDWRAVESGAHAYATRTGKYQPITDWKMEGPDLVGRLEIPMAVGTVGGMTRLHPTARVALKMLDVKKAEDLARICVAVGLIQNLGALKALSTVGIVRGHMNLHATNLAIAAGAELSEVAEVRVRLAEILRHEKHINLSRAREILEAVRVSSQNH